MASIALASGFRRSRPASVERLRTAWHRRHKELGIARTTEATTCRRWQAGSLDKRIYAASRRLLAQAEERERLAWHRLQQAAAGGAAAATMRAPRRHASACLVSRSAVRGVPSSRARRGRRGKLVTLAAAARGLTRGLVAGFRWAVHHQRAAGSLAATATVAGLALLQPIVALAAVAFAIAAGIAVAALHHQRGRTPRDAAGAFSARVQQAMIDVGLCRRAGGGEAEPPRLQGRPSLTAGGNVVLLQWALPPGVTLTDVLRRQEDLGHRLSAEVHAWFDRGRLHTEVLRAEIPTHVEASRFYAASRPTAELGIGVGEGRRGALFADLARIGHLLVGGMSQQGKSVFERQLLTHLVLEHEPDELRLLCLDFKGGVELDRYGRLPHALRPTVTILEDAVTALDHIRRELDRRTALLVEAGVEDLGAWHAAGQPRLPRIVVCTDELAQLTATYAGDKTRKSAQEAATSRLIELAQLGRAVGIHLIVCTQRPDAEAVPGALKANLDGKVAFRTANELNSRILLESDRAALLPPDVRGRGIWQVGARAEEFQAPYLSAAESRRLLEQRWGPLTPRCQVAAPVAPAAETEPAPETMRLGGVVQIHGSRGVLLGADDNGGSRQADTEASSPPTRVRASLLGADRVPDYDRFRDADNGVAGDLDGHGGPA